jgi:hypothetical protein
MAVLMGEADIITNIVAIPIGWAVILVITSGGSLKTDVIVFIGN